MTQVATKDTIASDIDNVHFTHGNLNYELHSTDDKLWVKISDFSNQNEAAEEYEISDDNRFTPLSGVLVRNKITSFIERITVCLSYSRKKMDPKIIGFYDTNNR